MDFGLVFAYLGIWDFVNFKNHTFLLSSNQSATGKMTVVAMGSFYVFSQKVSLTLYLPVKFSFLAVTPFSKFLYNLYMSLMI